VWQLGQECAQGLPGHRVCVIDQEVEGIVFAWRESQQPNAAWAERYQQGFDAAPYMTTFDNVLHLSLDETEDGEARPVIRALKATGMESLQNPIPLRY